jgi:hypothetical protein
MQRKQKNKRDDFAVISKEQLKSFSKLNNLKPWQQEKHYIQALILNSLAKEPLIFKGGTYLWFFHNLQRFSEDLDFTAISPFSSNLMNTVSKDLELMGVENSIKLIENNEASYSFRISAKGPLNSSDKDLCHVYIDISKREKIIKKPLQFSLNFPAYDIPMQTINCMDLDEIACEKSRAILSRNKSRDIYDLHFLIKNKNAKFSPDLVNQKLAYYGLEFSKKRFIEKIINSKKNYYSELSQLIFEKMPDFEECVKSISQWIGLP